MRLYNYSTLSDEDDKIYSIGGTKISSTGISMAAIKVVGPCIGIGFIFFVLLCLITKKQYWNPLTDFNQWAIALTIGLWAAIGMGLFYIRVQSYRLYQWLAGRVRPKYIYNNEKLFSNNRQKYTNYKINGPIKKVL